MDHRQTEVEDLKRIIFGFRVTDLQALLTYFQINHLGRKSELQNRALELLTNCPPVINGDRFRQKIRELFRDEQMQHKMLLQRQRTYDINRSNQYQRSTKSVPSDHHSHQISIRNNSAINKNGVAGGNNYYPNTSTTLTPVECNISNSVRILTRNISPANIIFKKLPFYNVKREILKPSLLVSNSPTTLRSSGKISPANEFQLSFVLNCETAAEIAMNRNLINCKHAMQLQLRISSFVSSIASTGITEYDDHLPPNITVRVNGNLTTLPPYSSNARSGQDWRRVNGPVDLTSALKLSPMNANNIAINWTNEANRTFVFTLIVVEKLSSDFLLARLIAKPATLVESTKLKIRRQFKPLLDIDEDDRNGDDDDVSTTVLRSSLVCPLAKFRMIYPAKGRNCSHLQCFDGSAFINLNEKKSMWLCPVCHKRLSFDDLQIDQYFMEILQSDTLAKECQEVQLFIDGTWKSYIEQQSSDENKDNHSNTVSDVISKQSFMSTVDTEEDIDSFSSSKVTDPNDSGIVNNTTEVLGAIVDLTCEDEEEIANWSENSMPSSNDHSLSPLRSSSSPLTSPQESINVRNDPDSIVEETNEKLVLSNSNNDAKSSSEAVDSINPSTITVNSSSVVNQILPVPDDKIIFNPSKTTRHEISSGDPLSFDSISSISPRADSSALDIGEEVISN